MLFSTLLYIIKNPLAFTPTSLWCPSISRTWAITPTWLESKRENWALTSWYWHTLTIRWHLGFCNEKYLPTQRGFQSHIGYWGGAEDYYSHLVPASSMIQMNRWRPNFSHHRFIYFCFIILVIFMNSSLYVTQKLVWIRRLEPLQYPKCQIKFDIEIRKTFVQGHLISISYVNNFVWAFH